VVIIFTILFQQEIMRELFRSGVVPHAETLLVKSGQEIVFTKRFPKDATHAKLPGCQISRAVAL